MNAVMGEIGKGKKKFEEFFFEDCHRLSDIQINDYFKSKKVGGLDGDLSNQKIDDWINDKI